MVFFLGTIFPGLLSISCKWSFHNRLMVAIMTMLRQYCSKSAFGAFTQGFRKGTLTQKLQWDYLLELKLVDALECHIPSIRQSHCSNLHEMASSTRYIKNNLREEVHKCQTAANSFTLMTCCMHSFIIRDYWLWTWGMLKFAENDV